MITITVDEDTALDMLVERVKFWTDDQDTIDLFTEMYENYIDSGYFDGSDFDVNMIVDNDYVNWCGIIGPGDEDYRKVKKLYKERGLGDISCETCYSYIEAAKDDLFLVRH